MGRITDKHNAALARFPAPVKTDGHPKMVLSEADGMWRGQIGQFAACHPIPFSVQEKFDMLKNMEAALAMAWALERDGLTINGQIVAND